MEATVGHGHVAARVHEVAANPCRVNVQDLEGDCGRSALLFLDDLDTLQREVASKFEYKSSNVRLWTRTGAQIGDIALIRDDDVLFSTDDSDFPQLLREVAARGLDRVANRSPLEEQVKQERDRRA